MIRLYRGEEAVALLQDTGFRRQWTSLYEACPYGTCFQDVPFATTWYQVYASQLEPIIVTGATNAGALDGLLLLAVSKEDGSISQVGAGQAEYHAWLAKDNDPASFIEPAFDRLAEEFPNGKLQFLFLPPGAPLEWTRRWRSRCDWRSLPRPLLSTAPGNEIADYLRKKKKKMRLNQLERLGELSFERIDDPAAFETALDEMTPLYDFRQGAMYGTPPFAADALKKPFYLAMMRQPGLLHVTALRLNGRIVSAHIGPRNKSQIVLGVIVQSPFLSRHSLGRIHILFLGLQAEKEGFSAIDLTPGAGYKEELATHHDEVYTLTVFFNRSAARRHRIERGLVKASKRFVSVDWLKKMDERIRPRLRRALQSPAAGVQDLKSATWNRKKARVYCLDLKLHPAPPAPAVMRRDDLNDLLRYQPTGATQPARREFLAKALEWLEEGRHAYTLVAGSRLALCAWLIEKGESCPLDEVRQSHPCAPNSAALVNFYIHPDDMNKELWRDSLRQMIADAASVPETQHIYLSLSGHDHVLQHIVEEAGFQPEATYYEINRLGNITRGREAAATGD
ncbi:MAG TPA: GNAT family N-acetyltransferase [Terriglobia bacterium]|nr:GNAT family N-acetyltransferase [Terriglobia bacterium]